MNISQIASSMATTKCALFADIFINFLIMSSVIVTIYPWMIALSSLAYTLSEQEVWRSQIWGFDWPFNIVFLISHGISVAETPLFDSQSTMVHHFVETISPHFRANIMCQHPPISIVIYSQLLPRSHIDSPFKFRSRILEESDLKIWLAIQYRLFVITGNLCCRNSIVWFVVCHGHHFAETKNFLDQFPTFSGK